MSSEDMDRMIMVCGVFDLAWLERHVIVIKDKRRKWYFKDVIEADPLHWDVLVEGAHEFYREYMVPLIRSRPVAHTSIDPCEWVA